VDILKMILVLLLLGTWFPCTAHCQLMNGRSAQSLVGQRDANLQAASRSGSGEDCRICDWVTSGGYEQSQTKVVAPEFAAGFVPSFYQAILDEQSLALNTGCETQRSTAPPELAPTFHFTFRMSLPPRAPSLIS
jgi:hypothetical protein